jgi:signal transduction histidine kinase/ActR/RegA family two-component response regulator
MHPSHQEFFVMALTQSSAQSSKSYSDLEKENQSLRRQLERAETIIRTFERETMGLAERQRIEDLLHQSETRLEVELADAKLLQSISAHLIHEEHIDNLYSRIMEAAVTIMQSDFASMQMYYPGQGKTGRLHMLASSGLSQQVKDYWEWVDADAGTICALAMRIGKRFISSDLHNCEFVVGTPDHEMFVQAGVLAAQSTPLFSRGGKLLGMISTHWKHHHMPSDRDLNLLDILARQAADLIERKSAEDALYKTQLALTDADRRKDEFLATLAHELRNPLAPIRNALHIMRIAPINENAPAMLAMMDRQVGHLVRLIDDLLDISRVGQGKIDLRRERIVLQNAVRDAVEASSPLIENSAHTLAFNLPSEPVWIFADLTRIAQVISNLLNNAAKYTPRGGNISVSLCCENNYAVLAVSDTGLGIPAEMQPKVFDLFTQVDRNLDRSQGGLGIGLALVKQLLDMHDGEIGVKSAGLNQGSTFTIRLPLTHNIDAHVSKSTIANDQMQSSGVSKALRVLVVDDNVASAETMSCILELEGHETKLTHDGNEVLHIAREFNPDAILLDIDLPGMSGHEVCRELRKNPLFKNTMIIAQTGFGQDRDRLLTKAAGFDSHLVKPFDFKQLSQLLSGITSSAVT